MADVDTSAAAVERLAVCADEVWADLPQQMGRASMEGHSVGQMLAAHQRGKIGHVAATLRALLARAEAAEGRCDLFDTQAAAAKIMAANAEAQRDAATAERDVLHDALKHLYACDYWAQQPVGIDTEIIKAARERARAALTSAKEPSA